MEKFEFENLMVYHKALSYIDYVYELTSKFPRNEMFGLSSQFQRASQSIALNIGEGSGGSKTEFRQFIRIARRSVRECVVCTAIAMRRKYITEKDENRSRSMASELSKMLSGLMRALLRTPNS